MKIMIEPHQTSVKFFSNDLLFPVICDFDCSRSVKILEFTGILMITSQ